MPLSWNGRPRKRWRYVGIYGPEVMICAARAEVGPIGQCFWEVWDRRRGEQFQHTRLRPGGREVVLDGPRVEINHRDVEVRFELGEQAALESICESGERGWGWTRKRAGVPASGEVQIAGRRYLIEAHAVDDESAGYHRRNTAWMWSAGVGRTEDGHSVAWNLVEGINDPPKGSERGIWLDGELLAEPLPVRFNGMDSIEFDDGGRLDFAAESERSRDDNFLIVRSRYRHRFGTLRGALEGGIVLSDGYGVMETHEARW